MSKHFSVNITVVDAGHFIDLNIHPTPQKNPTAWYSCIYSSNRAVRLGKQWSRGLNFSLTWSLFLSRVQVGCYFLASASRMMHTKSAQCLELSRRNGEHRQEEKKRWREKWDANVFFTLKSNLQCKDFKALTTTLLLAGRASFRGIFPHGYWASSWDERKKLITNKDRAYS